MEVVEGRGIRGLADGVKVSVGNESLMGEDAPGSAFPAAQVVEYGSTCCVAADGKVVGVIAVSDTVRDDAKQCIQMLKKMGVTAGMLTGVTGRFFFSTMSYALHHFLQRISSESLYCLDR